MDAIMAARDQIEQIIAYNRAPVDLMDAMSDMAYTPEERSALVKKVFADCQPALVSVLGVMAERGDVDKLPRVWDSFNQQISEKQNVTVVDVTTRVPLDDHLRSVIEKKAEADLGGKVVLSERLDSNILGGVIMSANGKRIDASVNTLLDNARSVLKKDN
jgi:F-type H+-transporting ATPase subunit delta